MDTRIEDVQVIVPACSLQKSESYCQVQLFLADCSAYPRGVRFLRYRIEQKVSLLRMECAPPKAPGACIGLWWAVLRLEKEVVH